jgi:SAM-dependent methyltransferase
MSPFPKFGERKWFEDHYDRLYRDIVENILRKPDQIHGTILDIGCESGVTDLAIAVKDSPQQIVGVDLRADFADLLQNARSFGLPLPTMPRNLSFLLSDGQRLPFPDNCFDIVFSRDTFEHIERTKLQMVVDEIRRVLKSDGLFYVGICPLYFSAYGHHLAHVGVPPYAHLNVSPPELGGIVQKSGDWERDWSCFSGLNKIRVSELEECLKGAGFKLLRAFVRSDDVDDSEALQRYSVLDLAISQIHLVVRK